jgi:GNAT superfamily N-acetyltransferase
MRPKLAESDREIERCFPVMAQLRPHLTSDIFVERIQRQYQNEGYRLAYIERSNSVIAVAGFRIIEMLSPGKFMYIDDLVTDSSERSKGHGDRLFDWLVEYARSENCVQVQLDSGVQRFGAHRFYLRKRMQISDYHFALELTEQS